ncbi:MAG TPA: type II toxin-antitoxin system VapB family antitoxin [Allosphingosinicella sp.]|jgi:Arc/MetJ family transcription regulator
MRTNIDIDDALLAEAMKLTGVRTKREAVEIALRGLVQLGRQGELRNWRGKLHWQGDLETMRLD